MSAHSVKGICEEGQVSYGASTRPHPPDRIENALSQPKTNDRRAELLAALSQAGRESSTATVLLHTAIAAKVGLSASDTKTLDVLLRQGPCTAGELARHTGLTTASVTSLIDRLEAKRLVRRVADPRDRRRVIVEPATERIARFAPMFGEIFASFDSFFQQYSDAELVTILDFLRQSSEHARRITAEITAGKTGAISPNGSRSRSHPGGSQTSRTGSGK
jgi:DNA-binding MarR family transcriptional regulator